MKIADSGLKPEEWLEVKRCAARGRKQGEVLHRAIVQRMREEMWRSLSDGLDLETVRAVMPFLMGARRMEAQEERESGTKDWPKRGVKEEQEAMRTLWGTLPEWHPGAEENSKRRTKNNSDQPATEPESTEECVPAESQEAKAMGESWEARAAAKSAEGGAP